MITYEDYSKKSFAVFGNKELHGEALKKIGAIWNPRMKPPGWYIDKSNEDKLKELISEINELKTTDIQTKTKVRKPRQKSNVVTVALETQKPTVVEIQKPNVSTTLDQVKPKPKTKSRKTNVVEQDKNVVEPTTNIIEPNTIVKPEVGDIQTKNKLKPEIEPNTTVPPDVSDIQTKNKLKPELEVNNTPSENIRNDDDEDDDEDDEDDEDDDDEDDDDEDDDDEDDDDEDDEDNYGSSKNNYEPQLSRNNYESPVHQSSRSKYETQSRNKYESPVYQSSRSKYETQSSRNKYESPVHQSSRNKYEHQSSSKNQSPRERIIKKSKERFNKYLRHSETPESREIFKKYTNLFDYYKLFSKSPASGSDEESNDVMEKMRKLRRRLEKLKN